MSDLYSLQHVHTDGTSQFIKFTPKQSLSLMTSYKAGGKFIFSRNLNWRGDMNRVLNRLATQCNLFYKVASFLCLLSFPVISIAFLTDYPGKLVDIGTHKLHLHCVGNGSPTIVIDSGLGGFSLEWMELQQSLSKHSKVCSYDRAGYGWSESGPLPRTTKQIVNELRMLLTTASIDGPYILIGHSFGGYNIRYFAEQYSDEVAGMVLIDSSHPLQFKTKEFRRNTNHHKQHIKNSYQIRMIRPVISINYPVKYKRLAYMLMSTRKSIMTYMNESENMGTSANQLAMLPNNKFSFPVIILSRGQRVWHRDLRGDLMETRWSQLQRDLESVSYKSTRYIARGSGHMIHLDQPDLVEAKIIATLKRSRFMLHERNLMDKYNIRLVNNSPIRENHHYNIRFTTLYLKHENNSYMYAYLNQSFFDNRLNDYGRHTNYFLR